MKKLFTLLTLLVCVCTTGSVLHAQVAPVFTVTGPESAVRGDALKLTANVTAGTPTPTIQWFSSDDGASITNPVAQGAAGTGNKTFDVPTTDVGIYYYYAVANNGIGGDGANNVFSDIKTITVKPKSPTITGSVNFVTSIKVFIKKADGEDDEAVIKYKIGDGEWLVYPDGDAGIELSATTTVYAKVVQSDWGPDIESAVVSATYTKVDESPQTDVPVSTLSGRNYASCVTTYKLDFKSADGITAYIATGLNGASDAVVLQEVDVVPAGTPIIVKTDTKGATVNVPVTTADADDVSGNKLVAGDGTTSYSAGTYYFLKEDKFHRATSGTLQTGKAYLKVAVSAPTLSIDFGTTNISTMNFTNDTNNSGALFDLQGRRVAQPTKGLYIVNGKKVVIK